MLVKNRVAVSLAVMLLILITATAAIFWARGFKPNFQTGQIDRTGLVVINSIPTGATVYLDDRRTSATNTTITYLEPRIYKVRIEKDGYTVWEKDVEIKADLATEIKALLFPTAPDIRPLTTTGAINPALSPDGVNIVYATAGERGGVYLLPMNDRPFPFTQNPKLLLKNQAGLDFTTANFLWSADSKQIIARDKNKEGLVTANILIETDKSEQELRDITGSINATLQNWQEELNTRAQTLAITVPDSVKQATAEARVGSSSNQELGSSGKKPSNPITQQPDNLNYYPTGLIFSPDEEKILYLDKSGKYQVYDLKTEKSSTLPLAASPDVSAGGQADLSDLLNISWYPDSNHLVVVQSPEPAEGPQTGGLISIIETDGANKMTIYSGKFENARPASPEGSAFGRRGFVFPHPSGSRLIILTTLTQTEGTPPNLYSINLK